MSELRAGPAPVLGMSLCYHQSLLLLHLLVLLAELRQVEFHDVLDQVVQLVLIMFQLCYIYYILFLEIGQDYSGRC